MGINTVIHTTDQQYIFSYRKTSPAGYISYIVIQNTPHAMASYSIHQLIDIINHVKLSATHALPLTLKRQPSLSLPDEHCSPSVHSQRHWHWHPLPWPPRAWPAESRGWPRTLFFAYWPTWLPSTWQAGRARTTRGCELSVIPTNGVAERWGSRGVLEPVISTGRTTQAQ